MNSTTSSAPGPPAAWFVSDLPRERLLARGGHNLSQAELLAVMLGTGTAAADAQTLARRLLTEHGSLDALLQAPVAVLLAVPGLGQAGVARLKAMHELSVRHAEDALREGVAGAGDRVSAGSQRTMSDSVTVRRYLARRLGYLEREVFGVMFLDTRHRLLLFETLFKGTLNRAHVHPREVLRRSIELNAAALILAHNHPSGVAEPSQADLMLTRELKDLCARLDIQVLDHVIVARSSAVSLASRGLL